MSLAREVEDVTMTNEHEPMSEYELREGGADYALEPTAARSGDEATWAGRPIPIDQPFPIAPPIWPWLVSVSGLYTYQTPLILPQPVPFPRPRPLVPPLGPAAPAPVIPLPWWRRREELRVDVDRHDPQMAVSGTIFAGLTERLHWIAGVTPTGPNQWSGAIWYKEGTASALPHTHIQITATRSFFAAQRRVTVRYSGGGASELVRTYNFQSIYHHRVEFEFDFVEGTTASTQIDTGAHPNRPATLPSETLTIENVYRRAGFAVSVSSNGGTVPLSLSGADGVWSDTEMHDAMQSYWSRFANVPQWALWVFFAARHEEGPSLGGIMFDSIGPNHRQGTAIFNDSFISDAPAGDPAAAAWVARMRFWTACHEMGHAFNLAHSWQKSHPPQWGTPWMPLSNEPEVRSFMNYPFRVAGGQTAFFADFAYRFSDQELLFMRHAPARFVQMGNADWFDDHGFEQAETSPEPSFRLELRVNRQNATFEFLEPIMVELKLTNVSGEPQVVAHNLLSETDHMAVILKKDGAPARQWLPFAQYCRKGPNAVLEAGESRYEALFVGAGRNGWDLAEPGMYTVQLAIRQGGEDLVSNQLRVRIAPPRGYDEEYTAQDFFSEGVGRVLAFDGSRELDHANDVLRATVAKLPDRRVAHHALVALAKPLARAGKMLALPDKDGAATMAPAAEAGGKIKVAKAKPDEARKQLGAALMKEENAAAETLGHIEYHAYVDEYADWLAAHGDPNAAAKCQNSLLSTLKERKVADWVLSAIQKKRDSYKKK
ncbi:MAG: hypothetical protein ACREJ5_01930 [Geminicoccaceae bacterium]